MFHQVYKKNANLLWRLKAAAFEFLLHRCSPDPDRIPPSFVNRTRDAALNVTPPFGNSFQAGPRRPRTNAEFKAAVQWRCTELHSDTTRLTMHRAAFINYRSELCQQASTRWQKMINTTRKFGWESAWSHLQSATMWNFAGSFFSSSRTRL